MFGFNLNADTRQRVARWILALTTLYVALRRAGVFAALKEQARRARLMRALPGPGRDKEHFLFGGHMSYILNQIKKEKLPLLDPKSLTKVIVPGLMELANEYPEHEIVRIYGISSAIPTNMTGLVVATGMNAVHDMLSARRMKDFSKGMAYDISEDLLGRSVLRESGAAWESQRPPVERGMTHKILEEALPLVLKTVEELSFRWDSPNGKIVDVRVDMLKLTMDVIGRVAFGTDFGSTVATRTEDAPLYLPFDTILKTLDQRAQLRVEHLFRSVPTPTNLKFNRAMGRLNAQVDEIVLKRLAQNRDPTEPARDLLDVLLQGHSLASSTRVSEDSEHKSGKMPMSVVKDNIKTALFAGHDTTGALLAWFMRIMAEHPEAQSRLRAEIHAAVGSDGNPAYEQIEELPFLNACVLEVLRLYPSAGFTRQPDQDTVIDGQVVPAGTEILFLPYLMHRNPKHWPNPNEFLPERMLSEGLASNGMHHIGEDDDHATKATVKVGSNGLSNRVDSLQSRIARISAKKCFFPFSLGPRNCVGRPLALLESRVVIIKLLQQFTFDLCDDPDYRPIPLLLLTLNPASVKLMCRRVPATV